MGQVTEVERVQTLIGISPRRLAELEDTERAFNALCELRRSGVAIPDPQLSTARIRGMLVDYARK